MEISANPYGPTVDPTYCDKPWNIKLFVSASSMKGCAASSSRTCRHTVSFLQKGGKGFEQRFPADFWFLHVRTTAMRSCARKVEIAKQALKSRLLITFGGFHLKKYLRNGRPLPLRDSAHLAKGTVAIGDRRQEFTICVRLWVSLPQRLPRSRSKSPRRWAIEEARFATFSRTTGFSTRRTSAGNDFM